MPIALRMKSLLDSRSTLAARQYSLATALRLLIRSSCRPGSLVTRHLPLATVSRLCFSALLFASLITVHFSLATASWGQTGTATLSGVIQDPKGGIVPDAEVTTTRIETGTVATTKTNGAGVYVFTGLMPGHFHLLVQKPGFKEIAIKDIELHTQDKLEQNFSLEIGSVSESITVEAGGLNINTTDGSVSTVIDRQFVENLPLNGRSFQSLETLAPGVSVAPTSPNGGVGYSGELTVNGQRTEANYFTVDGVSVNLGSQGNSFGSGAGLSGSVPGETALGTTQSLVSIDDLQEFRATTSTYSAEDGRMPGGQFSFVTRSGANEWHGSAFDYFRNEALDASNFFNSYMNSPPLPKARDRQNDFGGTLGGPLEIPGLYDGRSKTFFFFSYEGLRLETPQVASPEEYPDANLRQAAPAALQPVLNSFPIPRGADLGNGLAIYTAAYSNPSTLDSTSIRIDHNFGDKLKVFGRYSNTPSNAGDRLAANLAVLQSFGYNVKSLTLGATSIFTSASSNELRFNYSSDTGTFHNTSGAYGGATPINPTPLNLPPYYLLYVILNYGTGADLELGPQAEQQHQFNVTDTFVRDFGPHTLKFGVDYRRLATQTHPEALFEELIYNDEANILQNSVPTAQISTEANIPVEPIYTNVSLFAQDEWRATERLGVSAGVRWELNPPPGDAYGNVPYTVNEITNLATAQLAPKGTPLWHTTYTNFAPRFGVAYRLTQGGHRETVLRGGVGIFFDTGQTLASNGLNDVGYGSSASLSNVAFPLTPSQLQLPAPSTAPPYNRAVFAFDPNLKLPYSLQWSVALEQAIGSNQTLTLSYVAAAGRQLLVVQPLLPFALGNPNFTHYGPLILVQNRASSNYQSLQTRYQRRLSHGLQILASYTWSHSIDDASTNFVNALALLRGSSDFDIRNNFEAALTYDFPAIHRARVVDALLNYWSLDSRITARSALPYDVESNFAFLSDGSEEQLRADLVPGQPLYVSNPAAPGGRVANFNAFTAPTAAEIAEGEDGNAPRNALRGFAAYQMDLAVHRSFSLSEKLTLQIRAEAFNLLNHTNFGSIQNQLSSGPTQFGYATNTLNTQLGGLNPLYQVGGPRSVQLALRLQF